MIEVTQILNEIMKEKFHGKCSVWKSKYTDRIYLNSYESVVASIDPNTNKFYKHWGGWSLTTQRHINYFRSFFYLDELNKQKLIVMPIDYIKLPKMKEDEREMEMVNQKIKRNFVHQHIYCSVTPLITEILEGNYDRWEDVENLYDEEGGQQEIFEWWAVSSYLAEKLGEKGEPLFDGEYWGRTTTGQAIFLDGIIREICEELEILAGQKYSWEKEV